MKPSAPSLADLVRHVEELSAQIRGHLDGPVIRKAPPPELVCRLLAEPVAVPRLRRRVGTYFAYRGLCDHAEAAELCVSELLTNVIRHVGCGTPVTLRVTLAGPRPRIELTDPDPRVLPTLLAPTDDDAESGRGLALLDAVTTRWGATPHPHGKTVWCELGAGRP